MKTKSLITAAIAALGLLGAAPSAEARSYHKHSGSHVYISGHRSCGTPIYKERYFIGYDRYGHPMWRYRVVAAPVRYYPPPRRHYHPPAVCPPPYYHHGSPYRSGVVISGSFRL
jgi:hypothetical protein